MGHESLDIPKFGRESLDMGRLSLDIPKFGRESLDMGRESLEIPKIGRESLDMSLGPRPGLATLTKKAKQHSKNKIRMPKNEWHI